MRHCNHSHHWREYVDYRNGDKVGRYEIYLGRNTIHRRSEVCDPGLVK